MTPRPRPLRPRKGELCLTTDSLLAPGQHVLVLSGRSERRQCALVVMRQRLSLWGRGRIDASMVLVERMGAARAAMPTVIAFGQLGVAPAIWASPDTDAQVLTDWSPPVGLELPPAELGWDLACVLAIPQHEGRMFVQWSVALAPAL